jgi:broad specificity phosphatase PhoE
MKIYAIRHGQTELNVKGLLNGTIGDQLTDTGVQQASEARSILPNTLKRIYSSSLNRAKQTTEILNSQLELPVIYTDDLQEVNFGDLNGTPFLDEIRVKHVAMDYDWHPSGENVDDVKVRVLRALDTIAKENGDGEVLVVTHGGIIRMLHYLQDGKPLGEIENASLHVFDLDEILR